MKASLKKLLKIDIVIYRSLSKDAFGNTTYSFPELDKAALTQKSSSKGDSSIRAQNLMGQEFDGTLTLITDMLNLKPGDKIKIDDKVLYIRNAETYTDLKGIPQAQELVTEQEK